ncbi:hypothetical protein GDO81_025474 [Engystomops pustulosus]|uniref:Uncharacterized protein n=1 Tax=Engystomops pustulosus TaxID=76066 RepID=A0AAV6ZG78_ENGPU|nr:hypothetical protein GDO81_025474 [Engystomops pustulosus]
MVSSILQMADTRHLEMEPGQELGLQQYVDLVMALSRGSWKTRAPIGLQDARFQSDTCFHVRRTFLGLDWLHWRLRYQSHAGPLMLA